MIKGSDATNYGLMIRMSDKIGSSSAELMSTVIYTSSPSDVFILTLNSSSRSESAFLIYRI